MFTGAPVHSHRFLLRGVVLAFASGYLVADLLPFDGRDGTPTAIEIANGSDEPLSVTIREELLLHVGQVGVGETTSRELPNIGLYEVRAAAPDGKVVASRMAAPSTSEGVRMVIENGTIIQQAIRETP